MGDPHYKSWLQCSEGCPPHYDLTEIIYQCPTCGNLLEVKHDLDRLSAKSGQEWRTTFETRTNQSTGPYSSGVWSRKEWVCPEMDDRDIVTIGEGRTPIFDAKNLAKKTGIEKVWIKLCGNSHTGMPTARSAGAYAEYKGLLFYLGGECTLDGANFADTEAFDPVSNSWRIFARMPVPLHGQAAGAIGDRDYDRRNE